MAWYPQSPSPHGHFLSPPPSPYFQPIPSVVHVKEGPKFLPIKTWGLKEIVFSIIAEVAILLLILPFVENAINNGNIMVAIYGTLVGQFGGMYAVWMGFMIYATYRKGQRSFVKDFGFKFKWYDLFIGLGLGLATLTVQFIINLTVYFTQNNTLTGFVPSVPVLKMATESSLPTWYVLLFGIVLPIFCAPFFEELYFRGFIMGGMIRFFKKFTDIPQLAWMNNLKYVFATILSSIIFGMIHIQDYHTQEDWMTPILTGSTGLVFAISAVVFKRLGPGMIGHATHNSIITFSTI